MSIITILDAGNDDRVFQWRGLHKLAGHPERGKALAEIGMIRGVRSIRNAPRRWLQW